jgi:hypothetical protein
MRHFQLQKYLALPQKGKVIAEYVWIDGSNGIRSKSKVSTFQHRFPPPTIHCGICCTSEADWLVRLSFELMACGTN